MACPPPRPLRLLVILTLLGSLTVTLHAHPLHPVLQQPSPTVQPLSRVQDEGDEPGLDFTPINVEAIPYLAPPSDFPPDRWGNTIPDFSKVGYRQGHVPLPIAPVKVILTPSADPTSDDRERIQAAIDQVGNLPLRSFTLRDGTTQIKLRGAVLLKAGTYRVHGSLILNKDGVVLRGEGNHKNNDPKGPNTTTTLIATGRFTHDFIHLNGLLDPTTQGTPAYQAMYGTSRIMSPNNHFVTPDDYVTPVAKEYVPVGTTRLPVQDIRPFQPGAHVVIERPATPEWIHMLGMDRIPAKPSDPSFTNQWDHRAFTLSFIRNVVGVHPRDPQAAGQQKLAATNKKPGLHSPRYRGGKKLYSDIELPEDKYPDSSPSSSSSSSGSPAAGDAGSSSSSSSSPSKHQQQQPSTRDRDMKRKGHRDHDGWDDWDDDDDDWGDWGWGDGLLRKRALSMPTLRKRADVQPVVERLPITLPRVGETLEEQQQREQREKEQQQREQLQREQLQREQQQREQQQREQQQREQQQREQQQREQQQREQQQREQQQREQQLREQQQKHNHTRTTPDLKAPKSTKTQAGTTKSPVPEGAERFSTVRHHVNATGDYILEPDNTTAPEKQGVSSPMPFASTQEEDDDDEVDEDSIPGYLDLDIPIVMPLDPQFGGGYVYNYERAQPIPSDIGLENLALVSEYDPMVGDQDENHAWFAAIIDHCQNCWIADVTARQFVSGFKATDHSAFVTIQDCEVTDPISKPKDGGRRYMYMLQGQMGLVKRCRAREGRHDFITGAKTRGPNVFVDSEGIDANNDAGPHDRWSVGILYDNIQSSQINIRNRGFMGTGQGWAGAFHVLYHCDADDPAYFQSPPGATNWVVAFNGSFWQTTTAFDGPDATYLQPDLKDLFPVNKVPRSLYWAQLVNRLGGNDAAAHRIEDLVGAKGRNQYPET